MSQTQAMQFCLVLRPRQGVKYVKNEDKTKACICVLLGLWPSQFGFEFKVGIQDHPNPYFICLLGVGSSRRPQRNRKGTEPQQVGTTGNKDKLNP